MEREEDLSEDLEDLDLKRAFAFSRMAMVVGGSGGGGGGGGGSSGGEAQCVAGWWEANINPVEGRTGVLCHGRERCPAVRSRWIDEVRFVTSEGSVRIGRMGGDRGVEPCRVV